jgi:hypothetical protein
MKLNRIASRVANDTRSHIEQIVAKGYKPISGLGDHNGIYHVYAFSKIQKIGSHTNGEDI